MLNLYIYIYIYIDCTDEAQKAETVLSAVIYIYINILRGKRDATTFSRQACFVNRFTLQGFNERLLM